MRITLVIIIMIAIFLAGFLLFGEQMEAWLAGDAAVQWLRDRGPWAGVIAVGLLVADVLLPLPATSVMAALGAVYGPVIGGTIAAAGSFLSGMLAYTLTLALGRRAATWVLGDQDYSRAHRFFEHRGGWAVALSRWLPILPETIACLAGLARMPARRFAVALACGAVPMGYVFAAIGSVNPDQPLLAVALAAVIPILLWPVLQWLLMRSDRVASRESND